MRWFHLYINPLSPIEASREDCPNSAFVSHGDVVIPWSMCDKNRSKACAIWSAAPAN